MAEDEIQELMEFEIGFYIEIGILPEPSEQIIILKRNSQDSRNSDDQRRRFPERGEPRIF